MTSLPLKVFQFHLHTIISYDKGFQVPEHFHLLPFYTEAEPEHFTLPTLTISSLLSHTLSSPTYLTSPKESATKAV